MKKIGLHFINRGSTTNRQVIAKLKQIITKHVFQKVSIASPLASRSWCSSGEFIRSSNFFNCDGCDRMRLCTARKAVCLIFWLNRSRVKSLHSANRLSYCIKRWRVSSSRKPYCVATPVPVMNIVGNEPISKEAFAVNSLTGVDCLPTTTVRGSPNISSIVLSGQSQCPEKFTLR